MSDKGDSNDRQLWAEANAGGSTTRGKRECGPYDCRELVAFLEAHPERDNALIRFYIAQQQQAVGGVA